MNWIATLSGSAVCVCVRLTQSIGFDSISNVPGMSGIYMTHTHPLILYEIMYVLSMCGLSEK